MVSNKQLVSIVVPVGSFSDLLRACLESLLAGTWSALEVIVINEGASLAVDRCVRSIFDSRIRTVVTESLVGPARARNYGAAVARSEFLFFIDADCIACGDWVERGMRRFGDSAVVGVEGSVVYENPTPSLRDKIPINPIYNLDERHRRPLRDFPTGSVAYRKSAFLSAGGFDSENFSLGREDTDLGIRVAKLGSIVSCPGMRVVHRAERWTVGSLLSNTIRYRADVAFVAKHGTFPFQQGRVLHPRLLIALFFPPAFLWWARHSLKSIADCFFLPVFYVYLALARLQIWREAIARGVLVL